MSYITNQALNSRSMNGVLSITDGVATLENGLLKCDNINSSNINSSGISGDSLNSTGIITSNTNGNYTIPTSATNSQGLIISYGNTINSGSTDFTTLAYTNDTTKQGFRFNTKSSTTTLTNIGIIEKSLTYFSAPLTNCSCVTQSNGTNDTSLASCAFCYNNFCNLTSSQTLAGVKNFASIPTCSLSNPTLGTQLITKDFADSTYTTVDLLTRNNAWSGTISFNTVLPTSLIKATTLYQFVNYDTLTTTLSSYVLTTTLNTTLGSYVTLTYMNTTLGSYVLTSAMNTSLGLKANIASPTFTGTVSGITKAMVSLGNCDNTTDLLKPISTATQTALNLKANLASPTFTGTVSGITKAMVSLGNCDNTTDLLKPISTATQTALNLLVSTTSLNTTLNDYAKLSNSNIFTGINTFNISLPTSTITATSNDQLVNFSTLTGQGFTTLTAVQALGYTTLTNVQSNSNIFTDTNTFNLSTNMNSIAGLLVTGAYSLYNNLTTGSLRLATITSQIYQDAKTQLRGTINMFETQQINGSTTLTFPLSQTVNLRGTIAYVIELPIITASQEGMIFNFVKTQSISIDILLNTQSTNVIQYAGSLTQYTSENLLLKNGLQSTTLMCIQTATAGIFAWQELMPIYSLYKAISDLQYLNQQYIGQIYALLKTPVSYYLICDGSSYLKANYLQLWNVIQYTYGGSGINFNVPDFRGLFLRGLGTNTNTNFVGEALGTLQTDGIKNHQHSFTYDVTNRGGSTSSTTTTISTSLGAQPVNVTNNFNGLANETRPANQSVIWCIKYV